MYHDAVDQEELHRRANRSGERDHPGETDARHADRLDHRRLDPRQLGHAPAIGHVLGMQRRVGNRAVAGALVQRKQAAGPGAPVQRDDEWGRILEALPPREAARPDMTPEDWTGQLGVVPPMPLEGIQLEAPASPPPAPPKPETPRPPTYIPPERCQPGHHQRPERITFDDSVFVDLDRQRAWESFQRTISTLNLNWNSAVPLVNTFNDAQTDPTLQSDEMGLKTLGPGFVGDVAGMVEYQRVPPATRSGTTVGDLFNNVETDGITVHGTGLDRPPSEANIEALARDPKVREARAEAAALDGDIGRQILVVKSKAQGITKAAADLDGAQIRARLLSARDEETNAQGDLKRLEDAKKKASENAKKITGLLTKIVTAESPAKAGAAVTELAINETLELIAGQILDAKYGDQISAATRRLSEASAQVRSLAQEEVKAAITSATAQLAQAKTEFDAERAGLRPLLIRRRSAYEKIGRVIGSSSAAPPRARRQIQAIVTAIPLVETVVGRANNVVSTIGEVPYNPQAGIGLAMARFARWPIGDQFISSATSYTGLKIDFQTRQAFWQARLASLRGVMTRLSGLHTP